MTPVDPVPSPTPQASSDPDLVPLPGTSLSVWPWVALRGAGFPAHRVLALAAPTLAAAVDEWLEAGTAGASGPTDASGRLAELRRQYQAELLRIRGELQAIARDDRFGEAVIWQNRHAFATGIAPFIAHPEPRENSTTRQRERLIATYLQRYATKNDSIGFFGPIGWGQVTLDPEAFVFRPGAHLLSRRATHLETWGIDVLADRLFQDPDIRPFAPPRLAPYVRVEGNALALPGGRAIPLAKAQADILRLCDGQRTARDIARRILADPASGMTSESEVWGFLERTAAMQMLGWDFVTPITLHPEQNLRRLLERIEDPAVRERALTPLEALEAARAEVAAASGDRAALGEAIARLESVFTSATGLAATRAHGKTYAARTLVYEDCTRAAELHIGAPLLERIARPLALVFQSTRWLAHEVAELYRREMLALFRKLRKPGEDTVELAIFQKALWDGHGGLLGREGTPPAVAELVVELRRRWAEILPIPPGTRRLEFTLEELEPRVREAFAAPVVAAPELRLVAPDLMIVAPSAEAVAEGRCRFVLGEVHLFNTLCANLFVDTHPEKEAVLRLSDKRLQPRVMPAVPRSSVIQRQAIGLPHSDAWCYVFDREPAPALPERQLHIADLLLVERDGRLEVVTRVPDGSPEAAPLRFDCLDFLAFLISTILGAVFELLPRREYLPRISLGELVVTRETWHIAARDIDFAAIPDAFDRWVAARRWQRRHGMPRFVFVRGDIERKPYFVDFASPIYIDIVAKLIRQTAEKGPEAQVRVTEMLPGMDDLWLTDAVGQRYTSELRMLFIDGD